jgi:hypothetical protein
MWFEIIRWENLNKMSSKWPPCSHIDFSRKYIVCISPSLNTTSLQIISSAIFQLYHGSQFCWWRKPLTCRKSLTNFIEYTSSWTGLEITTLVVYIVCISPSLNTTSLQIISSWSQTIYKLQVDHTKTSIWLPFNHLE